MGRYDQYDFAKDWPSVTNITGLNGKDFMFWYKSVGFTEAMRVMEQSQKLGHIAESYLDSLILNQDFDRDTSVFHEDTQEFFKQAKANIEEFIKIYQPKLVMSQQVVYSKKHKYIGTLDYIYEIDGGYVLADAKTTNQLSKDYKYQLEAYYRAVIEMIGDGTLPLENKFKGKCLWITQFPKKEAFSEKKHVVKFTPKEERFEKGFLNRCEFYHYDRTEKIKS